MAEHNKIVEIVLEQDLMSVCSTAEGRRIIWEILSYCDLYSEAGADPNAALLLGGRRSVGLRILEMLNTVDPGIYIKMQMEHT